MKISVVVIAKNEEEMIADCLDSVRDFDEIILIDNGSRDRTSDIATHMGAKVVEYKSDDFSILRNFGMTQAKGDFIFYIDADERADAELIKNIKSNVILENISCLKVKRKNFYLGNHEWPKIEEIERVFKKEKFISWRGKLHESPSYEGGAKILDGFLNHYTHRNLSQMLEKTIVWSDVEAKNRFESGHPKMALWRFPRVMITTFFDYYVLQKGFKIGTAGLVESIYQSFSMLITYAKLWELQNSK